MNYVEFKINQQKKESPVFAMSLVKAPAMMETWVTLSEEDSQETLMLKDEEQQIITGPAMVPDRLIYRQNLQGGAGYGMFSKETVKECSQLFLSWLKNNEVTLEHMSDAPEGSISLVESWIVEDPKQDKAAYLGKEVAAGTWMLSYKIHDEGLWSDIKEGKYMGFSLEGLFSTFILNKFSQEEPKEAGAGEEFMEALRSYLLDS